jgi:hypothetical protein
MASIITEKVDASFYLSTYPKMTSRRRKPWTNAGNWQKIFQSRSILTADGKNSNNREFVF